MRGIGWLWLLDTEACGSQAEPKDMRGLATLISIDSFPHMWLLLPLQNINKPSTASFEMTI